MTLTPTQPDGIPAPHMVGGIRPEIVPEVHRDSQAMHLPPEGVLGGVPVIDESGYSANVATKDRSGKIDDAAWDRLVPHIQAAAGQEPAAAEAAPKHMAAQERSPIWKRAARRVGDFVTRRLVARPQHMGETYNYEKLADPSLSYAEAFAPEPKAPEADIPPAPVLAEAPIPPAPVPETPVVAPTLPRAPRVGEPGFVGDMDRAGGMIAKANAEADARGLQRQEVRAVEPTQRETGQRGTDSGGRLAALDLGALGALRPVQRIDSSRADRTSA